jgi:hypothetical protein
MGGAAWTASTASRKPRAATVQNLLMRRAPIKGSKLSLSIMIRGRRLERPRRDAPAKRCLKEGKLVSGWNKQGGATAGSVTPPFNPKKEERPWPRMIPDFSPGGKRERFHLPDLPGHLSPVT